jgi:hypothetical protein
MTRGCNHCPPAPARADAQQASAHAETTRSGDRVFAGETRTQTSPPLIVPRRGYTPARPSCIMCTEKHLGAAYVLLTETRHGYAHRLRAIGHLHEAEDESQAWPELHNAIREARKAYQAAGTMPDWDALAQTAEAVRQAAI